jgi:hypothetical protein
MTAEVFALFELPEPLRCWYRGGADGSFEREHQMPRSRGGEGQQHATSLVRKAHKEIVDASHPQPDYLSRQLPQALQQAVRATRQQDDATLAHLDVGLS